MEEKKTCNGCTSEENCTPEVKDNMTIPYVVHEATEARHERREKRYITALIIAIVLIFISNALWLYAWFQYDYVSEETIVEATDGVANYIGNDGDINNGKDFGTEKNTAEEESTSF